MAARTTRRRSGTEPPRTLDEASTLIRRLGAEQREIERLERELTEKVERLKTSATKKITTRSTRLEQYMEALLQFAQARRDELTEHEERKTVTVSSGKFGWRLAPPSLDVPSPDELLQYLKDHGLERFIRTKEEVNKKALLGEPAAVQEIPGISIERRELFFVKPSDVSEVTRRVDLTREVDAPQVA